MLRGLAYGFTLSIHYNSERKGRYIPYMRSRISAHLELHNNVIGLCIDEAAQVDTDCYIPRFSDFASPHLGVETESPPGHLPIHINAV
jgi:hypothetical protein